MLPTCLNPAFFEEGNLSFDNGFLKGGMPCNAVTGREYSGVNLLVLCGIANRFGYASNRWLTYKQAAAAGGNVKKGSKGVTVVYFDILKVEDDSTGEEKQIPMLKNLLFSILSNAKICPKKSPPKQQPLPKKSTLKQLKKWLQISVYLLSMALCLKPLATSPALI